jgi:hypothetical protein
MNPKFKPDQTVFYMVNNYIALTKVSKVVMTVEGTYYYMKDAPDTCVKERHVFATQAECREAIECIAV